MGWRCGYGYPAGAAGVRRQQIPGDYAANLNIWPHQPLEQLLDNMHVQKPKGSRPGFVTYTNEKTVLIEPRPVEE
ncbi:hypothetical protein Daudx_0334 [Candidatus Desulforudis audaxviator]|nr:hypothetical protein Daudx_0334 [Candidatus Desulforudis audaxviator]